MRDGLPDSFAVYRGQALLMSGPFGTCLGLIEKLGLDLGTAASETAVEPVSSYAPAYAMEDRPAAPPRVLVTSFLAAERG